MKVIGTYIKRAELRRYTPHCSGKEIRAAIEDRNRGGLRLWMLKTTWAASTTPPPRAINPYQPHERLLYDMRMDVKIERCKAFLASLRFLTMGHSGHGFAQKFDGDPNAR